jgi:hypothetical protein
MPTVEFHGFHRGPAHKLWVEISNYFQGVSYAQGMKVAIYPTSVRDLKGHPCPFLRLYVSHKDETDRILEVLQSIVPGWEIQVVLLSTVVPKKDKKMTHVNGMA